jgi:hypothetical protein
MNWIRRASGVVGLLAGILGVVGPMSAEAPATGDGASAARAMIVPGLSQRTLDWALRAYARARERGEVERPLVSIIDYSLPSTEKRLWVLDLERGEVLFHELVAHGRLSGDNEAHAFSNIVGSHQSSLGVFRTGGDYRGEHGISLLLEGLEPGWNDRAMDRAIVLHGAPYVSEQFAARWGRIGRSFGCPAVSTAIADSLIRTIRQGTLLFACYPDAAYAAGSTYIAQ